jgi:ubiquitin carboxyl-terminal hydrolase 14
MSSTLEVNVKWGKEAVTISFAPDQGVKALKAELEEKTGVPADRMKIMPKSKGLWKGLLKDDFDLSSIDYTSIKPPIQFLLMGSAANLATPKTKTIFVEDLAPEEAAKVAPEPSGLNNLGNTCYLNSVLQCLRALPVFRQGLNASNSNLLRALRDTYNQLDKSVDAISPMQFVVATKMAFPQFAQTGPQGQPMQQDAEEFYSGMLNQAAQSLQGKDLIKNSFKGAGVEISDGELGGITNLIDALFAIDMEETYTCDELDGGAGAGADMDETSGGGELEPAVVRHDLHRKLVCNIQGGSDASSQTNVTHIMEGISLALNGKVEKRSDVLQRDAIWTRKQRIARLPPVLAVQFGRFYWKETPDSQDHTGVKCKVMKPVTFNGMLDIYEFCSEKVQKVLKKARDAALKEEEDMIAMKLKGESAATEGGDDVAMETDDAATAKGDADVSMEAEDDEDLKAALAMSMAANDAVDDAAEDFIIGAGLPKAFQGKYELFAVVTHKGRDADGGHYMGWVKADHQVVDSAKIADTDEDNADWFVFDDDEVSPCKTEDVLKLKGGGDWHMSYLNFYRAKK